MNQVIAANDFLDALSGVINDDSQLIRRRARGLPDDEIAPLPRKVNGVRPAKAV